MLDLLRSIIEHSPAGYLVAEYDTDRVLFFSHRFCQLWDFEHLEAGMQSGDIRYSDLLSEARSRVRDYPAFLKMFELLHNTERGLVSKEVIPLNDGSIIGRHSIPMKDKDGFCYSRLYIDVDISEPVQESNTLIQNEAERRRISEGKYHSVFNASSEAIFITDPETGIILEANKAGAELLGMPAEDIAGRHLTEFYPDKKSRSYYKQFKRSMDTESPRHLKGIEMWLRRADGSEIPVELNVSIIELMGKKFSVGIFHDLTQRKRLERERIDYQFRALTQDSQRKIESLKKLAVRYIGLGKIEFFSESMREIMAKTERYHLDRSIPVLIQGEEGTGKVTIGKIIHFGNLENLESPFITLDCAKIPPEDFGCELFGCKPGICQTREGEGHQGKVDLAEGGTLLLRGVKDIPLEVQEKLLRLIRDKGFYRVGGGRKVRADARVILVSNSDPERLVEQGLFNRELYSLLKKNTLVTVPLRQRQKDLLHMANSFLLEFSEQKGKGFRQVGKEAAKVMLEYEWPGNIQELKNVIERAVITYDDYELKPEHLENIRGGEEVGRGFLDGYPAGEGMPLDVYISHYIQQVLERHNGNKAKTARYLGISRPSLYKYLRTLDIR